MSIINIHLISPKDSPWGLLTNEDNPRTLVWLTAENPDAEIDSLMLTELDIRCIQQGKLIGVIEADGIEEIDKIQSGSRAPKVNNILIPSSVRPQVAPSEVVLDVTQLMRKEVKRAQALEEKIKDRYPQIDDLLAKPANQLKKELKDLAKGSTLVSFFQECRKKEQNGKDRKSVIAVLVEIIQAKINAVGIDGNANARTGQTFLSDAYYDMIEEYEDEDEE
jgi:hypothetical protein